jgi:hypothetical protein
MQRSALALTSALVAASCGGPAQAPAPTSAATRLACATNLAMAMGFSEPRAAGGTGVTLQRSQAEGRRGSFTELLLITATDSSLTVTVRSASNVPPSADAQRAAASIRRGCGR